MPEKQAPAQLRAWMARAKVDQITLGKRLGVGQPTISNLVMGVRAPSLALAVRIQAVTGIPAADWIEPDTDEVTA